MHFQFRSPWEQSAALTDWQYRLGTRRSAVAATGKRPQRPPKSCRLWFPMWCTNDRWGLDRGVAVRNWNASIYCVLGRKGPWLDMPFIFDNLHIASLRLQCTLNVAAPRSVQWLPFRMRDPYGKRVNREYAIANYLELRDVIDRKNSELEPGEKWRLDASRRFEVRTLVLSRSRLKDSRIFRIYGQPEIVIVNESVRAAIEGAGIRGCSFAEVPIA